MACEPFGDNIRTPTCIQHNAVLQSHCGRGERALQLDDHLKNLLRELGHAINDTVSESDRITGAIAGVRAHGYDIVLKLDATIGLARRDAAAIRIRNSPRLTVVSSNRFAFRSIRTLSTNPTWRESPAANSP